MESIFDFIKAQVWKLVDSFKMKNPIAFSFVASILLGIYAVVDNLIKAGTIPDSILFKIPVLNVDVTIMGLIVCVLTLLGAHTPPPKGGEAPENTTEP